MSQNRQFRFTDVSVQMKILKYSSINFYNSKTFFYSGAPRLLQAIAKDDLIPFLGIFRSLTKRGEPFRALLISTLIAECAVLIGSIDYIAPVVDFFFLMSYCFVNIACTLQTLLKAPNWRPRFRYYHWALSLLGAVLCLFIMFATYWYYGIVVCILCAALYKYIEYKG